jgi:glycosyltransferase involved in cell wall biosynthesis
MPTISVVIPAYNAEKTVRETIESVLKQTFSDFELIVINDGSNDGTWETISSISDSRLKVFSYTNAGVAVSRNRGIAEASGEFISFLDADDLWTPEKLELQLKALQDHPTADVAYSWTDYIDETGRFIRQGGYTTVHGNVYAKLLLLNFIENGSNPLIRRQALDAVGEFDPTVVPAEDRDLWLRLAAKSEFVCVQKPQILYRQSPHSASANVFRQATSSFKVLERAFCQAPANLQYLKRHSFGNMYKCYVYKALENSSSSDRSLLAIKFLFHAIKNDPALLKVRVSFKVLLKALILLFFPGKPSEEFFRKYKQLFNITSLFNYLQTEP